MENLEVNLMGR